MHAQRVRKSHKTGKPIDYGKDKPAIGTKEHITTTDKLGPCDRADEIGWYL